MTTENLTITERLGRLGYTHARDALSGMDGRHAIYARGQDGYAIDRLNAKEAADFCTNLGG